MPIDFTQIDPEEFELLCEDLLRALGFSIEAQVARGPDLGKDITATGGNSSVRIPGADQVLITPV